MRSIAPRPQAPGQAGPARIERLDNAGGRQGAGTKSAPGPEFHDGFSAAQSQFQDQLVQDRLVPAAAGRFDPASRRHEYAFGRTAIHPVAAAPGNGRLAVSNPDDSCERQADAVTERVMRMPGSILERAANTKPADQPIAHRPEKLKQPLPQIQPAGGIHPDRSADSPGIGAALRTGAQPLDRATRDFMESRFGHDFSSVRIHSGAVAEGAARALDARAYTLGRDIVLGAGRPATGSREWQRLLAHELTHVIQQSRWPQAAMLMRSPVPGSGGGKPPVPKPGHTPFNFISESPALANWEEAVRKTLQNYFKQPFATYEEANAYFQKYLRSLPSDAAREAFADRMRDRVRKAFYRAEAAKPSYAYDPHDLARMKKSGAAPEEGLQLEHLEEVKTKVRGGELIKGHPERALDPANIYLSEGGPGGTAPKGTKHAEKWRRIKEAKKTSLEIRNKGTGKADPDVGDASAAEPPKGTTVAQKAGKAEAVHGDAPATEVAAKPAADLPQQLPDALPEAKVSSGASVGESTGLAVVSEFALNIALAGIIYYFNERHAKAQAREFSNDVKGLLPDINARLKGLQASIGELQKAFPLLYANVTVVYTRDQYENDYNQGSMRIQGVAVSHQNYQTHEQLIQAYSPLSDREGSTYSMSFSLPLFDEATAEKGASGLVRQYRQVRGGLTESAYKVRMSAALTLTKLADQDSALKIPVVSDLLGLLKDEDPLVRAVAAVSLSHLKAKIAIRYIQEAIAATDDDGKVKIMQGALRRLQQQ